MRSFLGITYIWAPCLVSSIRSCPQPPSPITMTVLGSKASRRALRRSRPPELKSITKASSGLSLAWSSKNRYLPRRTIFTIFLPARRFSKSFGPRCLATLLRFSTSAERIVTKFAFVARVAVEVPVDAKNSRSRSRRITSASGRSTRRKAICDLEKLANYSLRKRRAMKIYHKRLNIRGI